MTDPVFIAPPFRPQISKILQDVLVMEPAMAEAIARDGQITDDELFHARRQMRSFPSDRSLANTVAARLFTDSFLQEEIGISRNFFRALFEDTLEKAATLYDDKPYAENAIDHAEEVQKFKALLEKEVGDQRVKILEKLKESTEDLVRTQAERAQIDVEVIGDAIIRVKIELANIPMDILPLAKLLYEQVEAQAIAAPNLYKSIKVVAPSYKNGIVIRSVSNAKPFSAKEAYLLLTMEKIGDASGRLEKASLRLQQLPPEETQALRLGVLTNPINSFVGQADLTRQADGTTTLSLNVTSDPNLPINAGSFWGWVVGLKTKFAGQLFEANVDMGVYLALKEYYERCLTIEHFDKHPGVSKSPCYR